MLCPDRATLKAHLEDTHQPPRHALCENCKYYLVFLYRTYKYEYRGDLWKCPFECYHDDDCDFYVDVHSYCCYGKWSQDVNSYVVSWSNDVTLYVKNGKDDFNFPFQIIKKPFYHFLT